MYAGMYLARNKLTRLQINFKGMVINADRGPCAFKCVVINAVAHEDDGDDEDDEELGELEENENGMTEENYLQIMD